MRTLFKVVLPLFLVLIFTSCTSVVKTKYTTVKIHNEETSQMIINNDTVQMVGKWHPYTVVKGNNPLRIKLLNDSIVLKSLTVKPIPSIRFYVNPFNYPKLIRNRQTPNKYTYPKNVYLAPQSATKTYSTFRHRYNKGDFAVHLALPYINSFAMRPKGFGFKSSAGFFGLAVGADYYYRDDTYFNFTVGAITDFEFPIPAPVDHFGPHETMNSLYITASKNHIINRFSLGYGISLQNNTWRYDPYGMLDPPPDASDDLVGSNLSSGFLLSGYWLITPNLHSGIVYRPSLFRFDGNPVLIYEHSISLEIVWKIKL